MTYKDRKHSTKADLKLISGQRKRILASNPDTPPAVLEKLSTHDHPETLERVAENPNTPSHTLDKLSKHESSDVRGAVSENSNTSMETLQSLAADDSPDVRYRLAENPNTPIEVLETLVEDENPYVFSKAQNSLETWKSVSQRADEMLLQDRFNEAEHLYRLLVQGLEELLGPEHHELSAALHKLAAALSRQNKLVEAAELENRATLIKKIHQDSCDK